MLLSFSLSFDLRNVLANKFTVKLLRLLPHDFNLLVTRHWSSQHFGWIPFQILNLFLQFSCINHFCSGIGLARSGGAGTLNGVEQIAKIKTDAFNNFSLSLDQIWVCLDFSIFQFFRFLDVNVSFFCVDESSSIIFIEHVDHIVLFARFFLFFLQLLFFYLFVFAKEFVAD